MTKCYANLARFQDSEQAMGHYDSATATSIPVFALAIAKPRSSTASASEDEPWQTQENTVDSKLIDVGWRFERWLALCIFWLTNAFLCCICFLGRLAVASCSAGFCLWKTKRHVPCGIVEHIFIVVAIDCFVYFIPCWHYFCWCSLLFPNRSLLLRVLM